MPEFDGIRYRYTPEGMEALLHGLSGGMAPGLAYECRAENIPINSVRFDFSEAGRVILVLPFVYDWTDALLHMTERWLKTWPLFLGVRLRFPEARGHCTLQLDDHPTAPGLAFSSGVTSNLLIPDPDFLHARGYARQRAVAAEGKPWVQRLDQVFWRGATTGFRRHLRIPELQDLPRIRLCLRVQAWDRPELFDVGLTDIVQMYEADPGTIRALGLLKPRLPAEAALAYRYAIDIDGNANSWSGLMSKLIFGNTVLKVDSALGYRQWFYDQLIPFKNFVPVRQDAADLLEVVQWLQAHPEVAAAIAGRGRALAESLTYEAAVDFGAQRIAAALRTD